MVKISTENSAFPPPDKPRGKGRLEYCFANSGHKIQVHGEFNFNNHISSFLSIGTDVAVSLFLFALVITELMIGEPIFPGSVFVFLAMAIFSVWSARDSWLKRDQRKGIQSEIEICSTHIQIKRHGGTIYFPREKVISAYVTADGAWAEVELREDDHCDCDLLIFYWKEHAELLWVAELVDRVLILGEAPVATPPPCSCEQKP